MKLDNNYTEIIKFLFLSLQSNYKSKYPQIKDDDIIEFITIKTKKSDCLNEAQVDLLKEVIK